MNLTNPFKKAKSPAVDESARLQLDDGVVMQLGEKMYSQDQYFVLLRECVQNALDAGATEIRVTSNFTNVLTVEDNGSGMTKQQLLTTFLTVGGSDKLRTESTVGGFGIAKLAIFACEDFKVQTGGYMLTKEILINHQPLAACSNQGGTIVDLRKTGLFSYSSRGIVEWFLRSIDRPSVSFYLNGSKIHPATLTKYDMDEVRAKLGKDVRALPGIPNSWHCTVVRANGLPVFKDYIYETGEGPNLSFVYDIETDLQPYDPAYPFTITRDQFNAVSMEKTLYDDFKLALSSHFRNQKKLEQQKSEALTFDSAHDLWMLHNPTICELSLETLRLYKKAVCLLYNLNEVGLGTTQFGLIGASHSNRVASYTRNEEKQAHIFFINETVRDVYQILACAIHEFSHRAHADHYENFASEMTEQVQLVLSHFNCWEVK